MSKVAVVYWSGTGNTEAMAMAVAEGAKGKGAEVSVITAAEFSPEQVSEYSAIAFGCPSMGSEQLEAVRLLRLGRWRMDAQLGVPLQRRRRQSGL